MRGIVITVVVCALVLSSFGYAVGQDGEEELILRVAMQDDIRTLNPLNAVGVWSWNVLKWLYDSPVHNDPYAQERVPYIAVGSLSSYRILPVDWGDCTVGEFNYTPPVYWENENNSEAIIFYDFTDIYWHDGKQMSIRDVLFSYHVTAQIPDWYSKVSCLKDKGGRFGSNYPNDHKLHIEVVFDEGYRSALKFTLQEPYSDFFTNTLGVFLIPYHIWGTTESGQENDNAKIWLDENYTPDDEDAWDIKASTAYENSYPVGSGPFSFVEWNSDAGWSKISTNRNHFYKPGYEFYPKARQPNVDGIVFKIFKTAEAAVLALQANDVDYIAWSVPPTFVGDLANEPEIELKQSPEQGFHYLSYNMRKESFGYDEEKDFPYAPEDDFGKPFRKAVAHCIDKNKIVQRLLLNFGIPGEGPVSSVSSWYNASIPKYIFEPDDAIDMLTNAGYQLTDPGIPPGPGNWWLRPDGLPIGNGPGGKIEILCTYGGYDPRPTHPGIMIATELQNIGIYAESIAMDFGSIVDRIDNRQFDMYILNWKISSDPTEFLHSFFHSNNAVAGPNFPGYQNESFDAIIDYARQTNDKGEKKKAVMDAQATIAYDLPYDVLYYRTNIEAYRSDRFVGWSYGLDDSIFTIESIYQIRAPSPHRVNAKFVNPPSAMYSNSTVEINVMTTDHQRLPLWGAQVWLGASMGNLTPEISNTTSSGRVTTTFTAPYVPPTEINLEYGVTVVLNVRGATYTDPNDLEYDPAPSRLTLIQVYPESVKFISMTMSVDPDVIDPDIDGEAQAGMTQVTVQVKVHTDAEPNGIPVENCTVDLEVDPTIPIIEPLSTRTDGAGRATFTVTSTDLPDDDGSVMEFLLIASAEHPDKYVKEAQQSAYLYITDVAPLPPPPPKSYTTEAVAVIAIVFLSVLALYSFRRRNP
jgi:ABC-type transport system substrate-binding protein